MVFHIAPALVVKARGSGRLAAQCRWAVGSALAHQAGRGKAMQGFGTPGRLRFLSVFFRFLSHQKTESGFYVFFLISTGFFFLEPDTMSRGAGQGSAECGSPQPLGERGARELERVHLHSAKRNKLRFPS